MSEHKHTFETKYISEVLTKLGKKRYIVVRKCTGCMYERATDFIDKIPGLTEKKES